jgi:hypothetical protein
VRGLEAPRVRLVTIIIVLLLYGVLLILAEKV